MLASPPYARVVIPTYNERVNLPIVVRRILRETEFSVLIVDDNSPDGTGRIADALATEHPDRVAVMHRKGSRGLGHSYIDGFRRAIELGAELICQMDADLSHDPKYLDALVAATAGADVAVGSRYVTGVSVANWPLRRLLLSITANEYVRIVTGLPVRDTTSGFKCWRRDALALVLQQRLRSQGYALQFEMLYHAYRFRRRIVEVPIVFVERREGASKMSGRVIAESVLQPWRLVLGGPPVTRPDVARHPGVDLRGFASDIHQRRRPTPAAEHQS